MALSPAEKQAAYRERQEKRNEVIRAAKSFVPSPGPRQDRAVKHALWHLDAYERGEIASAYPAAIPGGQRGLPVGSSLPDWLGKGPAGS